MLAWPKNPCKMKFTTCMLRAAAPLDPRQAQPRAAAAKPTLGLANVRLSLVHFQAKNNVFQRMHKKAALQPGCAACSLLLVVAVTLFCDVGLGTSGGVGGVSGAGYDSPVCPVPRHHRQCGSLVCTTGHRLPCTTSHVFFKAGYRLVQSGKTSQKRWQAVHRSNNNIRSRTCTYNFNHNHSD